MMPLLGVPCKHCWAGSGVPIEVVLGDGAIAYAELLLSDRPVLTHSSTATDRDQ